MSILLAWTLSNSEFEWVTPYCILAVVEVWPASLSIRLRNPVSLYRTLDSANVSSETINEIKTSCKNFSLGSCEARTYLSIMSSIATSTVCLLDCVLLLLILGCHCTLQTYRKTSLPTLHTILW